MDVERRQAAFECIDQGERGQSRIGRQRSQYGLLLGQRLAQIDELRRGQCGQQAVGKLVGAPRTVHIPGQHDAGFRKTQQQVDLVEPQSRNRCRRGGVRRLAHTVLEQRDALTPTEQFVAMYAAARLDVGQAALAACLPARQRRQRLLDDEQTLVEHGIRQWIGCDFLGGLRGPPPGGSGQGEQRGGKEQRVGETTVHRFINRSGRGLPPRA